MNPHMNSGKAQSRMQPMAALGDKQTYAVQKVMSASPPIATANANFRKGPCPLYPQKRTCAVQLRMSALGQKRTLRPLYLVNLSGASHSGIRDLSALMASSRSRLP